MRPVWVKQSAVRPLGRDEDNMKGAIWDRYLLEAVARELSSLSRYYDRVIQWCDSSRGADRLLSLIDSASKESVAAVEELPDLSDELERRTLIVLDGASNHGPSIRQLLEKLRPNLARTSRIAVVCKNRRLHWLRSLSRWFGVGQEWCGEPVLLPTRIDDISQSLDYEMVRARPVGCCPLRLLGIGQVVDRLVSIIPVLRWLSRGRVFLLRPLITCPRRPSLSIVIPARNERGNIENAVRRLPDLSGVDIEVVFVEGHSKDGTWEEIQRVAGADSAPFRIKALRQTGRGKADAVRLGFAHASGELLTILDADLTMPPERLGDFYDAYCHGQGDFVNGNRLRYPMAPGAMRPLNRLGNPLFAALLSFVLEVRLEDSLCGTKLFARHDYERFLRWRDDFGDYDPFGDFNLLFPAAVLGLGIVEVPIPYDARDYGTSQIRRFRDGWRLLRMTLIGLMRIRAKK